jgi:phage shock protein PspC (stress-responsive transcriptional regulator)
MDDRKLRRVTEDEWIGGVCGGVAYWLGVPVWLTRLVWTCAALFYGIGIGLYILLWIFLPKWEDTPADYEQITGD